MTLAVEPMVVAGRRDVKLLADQWTVMTEDGKPATREAGAVTGAVAAGSTATRRRPTTH